MITAAGFLVATVGIVIWYACLYAYLATGNVLWFIPGAICVVTGWFLGRWLLGKGVG